jgi:hypothetical protein
MPRCRCQNVPGPATQHGATTDTKLTATSQGRAWACLAAALATTPLSSLWVAWGQTVWVTKSWRNFRSTHI